MILALIIFTLLALSFNQKGNSDLESRLYHEAVVAVTELGDSFINEMSKKPFDAQTVTETVSDPIELTPASSLGPSAAEKAGGIKTFNDLDDYNNYKGKVNLKKFGECEVEIEVYYINIDNPDVKVTYPTWYKRVDIEIKTIVQDKEKYDWTYVKDPVKLYYIASY